jgi:hypothetical protein
MTQVNSFGTIIRQDTEHAKPAEGKQALVAINVRTGQAVPRPGLIETLTGDFRYFLVSNNSDPTKVIKGTKRVRYKSGAGEISLAIGYEGGCRPGHERWLAECFFKSSPSEDSVKDALARWLIEHFSSGAASVDDFYSESAKACAALATRAGQEFGLEMRVTLELEETGKLETIDSGLLLVFSRMKDSDDEEGMWLKAELEVDQQRIPSALLSRNMQFKELLEKGTRGYVSTRVTLDAFYKGLQADWVRQELRGHLDGLLRPFGRKVGYLSLKPDDTQRPPETFKGETVIEYQHHEYPDPIRVNVSVLMTLESAAHYKAKGSPGLEDWLKKSLRDAIDVTLFGVSYVVLLLEFTELKRKIDDLMALRAEEIGYHIEQLMTILHLEPFEWLKRIDIEIRDADALFETSLSNFHVGLEMFLTCRIKDLRGISPHLSAKQDVPRRMREELIRLVRGFMHGTNPKRFCLRYSRRPDGPPSKELSFEEELRLKVHDLLETEFNAEVLDLILKPTQTELMAKLREVSKGSHDFKAAAELGSMPSAPTMIVSGSFKVTDVNGWEAFKECEVNAEAIRKRIQDSIRARLKAARDEQLTFSEQTGFDALVGDALLKAAGLIGDEFGLAVKITTAYWDWEDGLKQIGREQDTIELAAVQERIRRLREHLLDLLEVDANPAEIKDTEERIQRLSATLKPALASSIGIQHLANPETPKRLQPSDLDQVES